MNDILNDPKAAFIAVLGVLMGVLAWLGKGALKRIESLERHSVTKSDLKVLHEENLGNFKEVKELIRQSNESATQSRHDLRDKIGVVAGQVARIEGQLSGRYPRLER